MCARWSGGPLIGVFVSDVEWRGQEHLKTHVTSDWAERSFCAVCGSGLLWRMTHPKLRDTMSIPVGTLDDREGLELTREWFYDQKPSLYSLAGDRPKVTEAEAFLMLDEALAKEG
jgi:hypothetical protein